MAEHSQHAGAGGSNGNAPERDVNLKAIVISGVGLAALVVVTAVLMLVMIDVLRSRVAATDPELPFLPEAQEQEPPPEPRLQADPAEDMNRLRAEEAQLLENWEWTYGEETARIPIERAMEIIETQGLAALPSIAGEVAAAEGEAQQ